MHELNLSIFHTEASGDYQGLYNSNVCIHSFLCNTFQFMISYDQFADNCRAVYERIHAACERCGRDASTVQLLPVTKVHPVEVVAYAVRYGFAAVGENKVQEAVQKQELHPEIRVRWELIGHLQSNKAKLAACHFDRIQTVDSIKLAAKLQAVAADRDRPLHILLQVNAGDDPSKFGVSGTEAPALLEAIQGFNSLRVDGLMTIAPLASDPAVARTAFERLRLLRDELSRQSGLTLTELSMGMTDDLEAAIAAGSTQVRIGTALFGAR